MQRRTQSAIADGFLLIPQPAGMGHFQRPGQRRDLADSLSRLERQKALFQRRVVAQHTQNPAIQLLQPFQLRTVQPQQRRQLSVMPSLFFNNSPKYFLPCSFLLSYGTPCSINNPAALFLNSIPALPASVGSAVAAATSPTAAALHSIPETDRSAANRPASAHRLRRSCSCPLAALSISPVAPSARPWHKAAESYRSSGYRWSLPARIPSLSPSSLPIPFITARRASIMPSFTISPAAVFTQ